MSDLNLKNALRRSYERKFLRRLWPRLGQITLRRMSALGDELLLTGIVREIKKARPTTKIKVECSHPEIFLNNPNVDEVVSSAQRMNPFAFNMNYEDEFKANPKSSRHLLEILCDQIGIECSEKKLEVKLSRAETEQAKDFQKKHGPYLTLNTQASDWSPNKQWLDSHWQDVVDHWSKQYTIIQLGLSNEPKLNGVVRLAGKTSIRECFSILSGARAHLGIVSFLMHAAQAVGTRSVIVYGGYEAPSTSSYKGNETLFTKLECSPCWLRDQCPYDLKCMRSITPEQLHARIARVLGDLR